MITEVQESDGVWQAVSRAVFGVPNGDSVAPIDTPNTLFQIPAPTRELNSGLIVRWFGPKSSSVQSYRMVFCDLR